MASNLNRNPIVLKIHGGTRSDKTFLCRSCTYAHIRKGASDSQESISCTYVSNRSIKFPIVECNDYENKASAGLNDMKDIAWQLVTKRGGREIGFKAPQKSDKQAGFGE